MVAQVLSESKTNVCNAETFVKCIQKYRQKTGEYADGIIQMPIGCEARQGEAVDGALFSCYDTTK